MPKTTDKDKERIALKAVIDLFKRDIAEIEKTYPIVGSSARQFADKVRKARKKLESDGLLELTQKNF